MKNKIFFFGSLCLVLALGLVFVGCEDNTVKMLGSPKVTAVSWNANDEELTLDFNAVKNASYYDVVVQLEGKNPLISVTDSNIFRAEIHPVMSSTNTIPDLNKWVAILDNFSDTYLLAIGQGTYKVGVIAESANGLSSNPGWAPKKLKVSSAGVITVE